ncbi:MAG: methyltransferase domain-containing protein [Opitutaceae bacterium]
MSDVTYDLGLLEGSLAKWNQSSGLRLVYRSIFADMMAAAGSGAVLDIGSGAGFLKIDRPNVTTSDVVKTPFVDCAVSAYEIQALGRQWDAIVAMDVLHHLRKPLNFLESASGSLNPGGRIVLVEPAATGFGRLFYRWFHHEPCQPERLQAPYRFEADDAEGNFANMGMGCALFRRDRVGVGECLKAMGLKFISVRYRDVLAYPSTGGLAHRQILPTWVLKGLLGLERILPQWVLSRIGLRMIVVLERVMP